MPPPEFDDDDTHDAINAQLLSFQDSRFNYEDMHDAPFGCLA